MAEPRVSIVVPVHNTDSFLEQCLESLVNQTLDECEIIVVNDGSSDKSQDIIDVFVEKYPNIIRSFIKENGGPSDARNYGVLQATGEYIGFVDSDDYVREDMFELLYDKAKEDDADVVATNYVAVADGKLTRIQVIKKPELFNEIVENQPTLLFNCKCYVWNKIYRREWYVGNGFEFPVGQYYEDSALIYNVLYMAQKISFVDDYPYFYRRSRQGSTTNIINEGSFDVFKSVKSIMTFFQSHTSNEEVLLVAERLCQIHIFTRLKIIKEAKGNMGTKIRFYHEAMTFFKTYTPNWVNNPYYQKVKKDSFYFKYRHIPALMYLFLLIPPGLRSSLKKGARVLRRTKS